MIITHSIYSVDKNWGGTSTYLQQLANELRRKECINILAIQSQNPIAFASGINLKQFPSSFPYFQGYSKTLRKDMERIKTEIFHGNGTWQYPMHAMSVCARERRIPYILSPHGMLESWALNAGKWKKKIALELYQKKDLARAACIHTTADMEADQIRVLGFKNPIAVIPNGINIEEFPVKNAKSKHGKRTILFLSRIHPKKGIEFLIEAWRQLEPSIRKHWQVEIAGNGDATYISSLLQQIKESGLLNEIKIIGPQFGANKQATYQRADLFVLPTHSENFGIVIAEALTYGVPVITTKGTPWEELNSCNAGWWIEIGTQPLLTCLNEALQKKTKELEKMGLNGRRLVEEKYDIKNISDQMIELYNWVLKRTEKPSFVRLD